MDRSQFPSRHRCISVLYPATGSYRDVNSSIGSQPIIQFKELAVDHVRYDQWKAMIAAEPPPQRRRRSLPPTPNKPTVPSQL